MKRFFFTIYFLVVLANILLIFTDAGKRYDRCILNIQRHYIYVADEYKKATTRLTRNFTDEYKEATNRFTRNCTNVRNIQPGSGEWNDIQTGMQSKSPRTTVMPRGISRRDDWFLVETDFSTMEPAIVLFKKTPTGIASAAIYGGNVTPFKHAPAIRSYFIENEPSVPHDLIKCYDPLGPPFN